MRNAPAQGCGRVTLTGHPARSTASSLSRRGVVCSTAHKRMGGPRLRAYATGALFVPLEHPKLLGSGHGSLSLRVTPVLAHP